jgi:hypothetical protein
MSLQSTYRARRALFLAAAVLPIIESGSLRAADITSSWTGGTGSWSVAGNWTNVPAVAQYPNNGNGGFTYGRDLQLV